MPSADWLACTAAPHRDSGKSPAPPILSLQNRRPLRSRLRSSDALGASLQSETNFWRRGLFVPRRQRSLAVPEALMSWCPRSEQLLKNSRYLPIYGGKQNHVEQKVWSMPNLTWPRQHVLWSARINPGVRSLLDTFGKLHGMSVIDERSEERRVGKECRSVR